MTQFPKKRKSDIDSVELTGDDDSRPQKTNRTTAYLDPQNVSSGQRFGESTDYIPLTQVPGADEDDAEATELVQGTQDADDSSMSTNMRYGTLDTKIVGCRFYNGIATPGEHVLLQREPSNQYDRNAIQVRNIMGAQIGHIPRAIASKLAPYMDSRELLVEGVLTGHKSFYDCPVALPLYGTSNPAQWLALKNKMKQDRLPLREFNDAERKEKARQKGLAAAKKEAEKQARAMALKQAAAGWQGNDDSIFANLSTPTGLGDNEESFEDLLKQSSFFNPREIGQVVENFGQKETEMAKMPMADTPAGLLTELLPYQKQGLAWMVARESPSLPSESGAVVQLWKKNGNKYTNIATNFVTSTPPTLVSGGILADDMGLGKTIQVISLILANPTPRSSDSSKTTLIIAPVGVMSNWRNQIQDHCKAETMPRVLIYHGSGKKEAGNLADYDVVITSYGALGVEYKPEANKAPAKGIFSVHWRRVVLDEGHGIRNPRTKGSLAATALKADSRWALTGTPIINSLKDLYSQIRFLKLTGGLEDLGIFNSVLIRPLTSGQPEARLLLEALMGTICLRRRKDMDFINLRLPTLTSRVLRIKFHKHEQEKYQAFQDEAKGALLDFKDKQGGATYSHLLEVILRLRQTCNHWALCKKRIDKLMEILDKHKVVPLTPENMKALQDMLQIQIESQEVCAICLDNFDEPVITACAHSFCKGCIEQVIERQHRCPLCRAEINDNTTLVSPAAELGEDTETVEADPSNPSSKIEALMKVLTAQGQAPDTKTVVFSQWTSFLDLVEPHLAQRGINYVRVDGKMNSTKRDNSISKFSTEPTCTVLLASLSVCSVGLNLVAANQAILADSWWAPAIEDQALDRVHRLGQKRETNVWRLIMEDTIEERVLDIQGRKRELMLTAFRETGKKKAEDRATRVADLETLLT